MENELRSDVSISMNYAAQIISVCESATSTAASITNSSTITASQDGYTYYCENQQTLQLIKELLSAESNDLRNIGVMFDSYDAEIASEIEINDNYGLSVEGEDSNPIAIPCPTPTPSPIVPEG